MDSTATLRSERVLPHPPEAIVAAFADPTRLAAWWGPAGFTNSFEVFEFRPGGAWVFVMHGPDGQDYPNRCEFLVTDADRIVIRHSVAPLFTLTVRLQAVAGGTRLTWLQAFDDPTVADALRAICEPANQQNLDRLAAVLNAPPTAG
ncbi:MAG TPA: SRPBCC domain-containing protein [Burkholderiaceae bacterium]|nr:SRPBCC domain-containing protein [Burkholderiaceae bacterium]HMX09801.1 SRPBCC domain-containing protein [Burkholderiaceae bacterium]HMY99948.1 SRPBCC domain-containing protein [Burkholderiaceae bacterium]HNB43407.1 SRPBCC domain-containing protein [Burkholderiaceae bacterium]HNG79822.1 SRPBCC domain-containing protein [Burkholderiaceae bacterium]